MDRTLQKNLKAWLNIRDNGMISWSKVVIVIAVIALILLIWKKAKDMKTILRLSAHAAGGSISVYLVSGHVQSFPDSLLVYVQKSGSYPVCRTHIPGEHLKIKK